MTTALRAALLMLGLALGVAAFVVLVTDHEQGVAQAVVTIAVPWTFLVTGLVAWWRRPASRLGVLMTLLAFALLLRKFQYSDLSLPSTVGFLVRDLPWAMLGHVVLSYPTGRLTSRLERTLAPVVYAVVVALPAAALMVYDPRRFPGTAVPECDPAPGGCARSLLLVRGDGDAFERLQRIENVAVYGGLSVLFIFLIVRAVAGTSAPRRRMLAPLLVVGFLAATRGITEAVWGSQDGPDLTEELLFWSAAAVELALPIALLVGVLQARLARAHVADLVLELERTAPSGVRDALARALGDPTLEVAFWLPNRGAYVNAAGEPVALPEDGPRRAVTPLDCDGEPVAALVHDPALRAEPDLVEASCAAARLALENARLNAEVRAQLAAVQESRARIVAAGDAERRRIERDLHDGAQQRLVALALALRVVQRKLGSDADPEVERVLAQAVDELEHAVTELRELARGVHPAILTEEGLAAALESLASRSPVPVTVDAEVEERLAPELEATAYFVACEALANAVKHANASTVAIDASRVDGRLVIAVTDDGVGGADVDAGTGLRGLCDRVQAHGGGLRIESAPGRGTRIVGELPCAS